LNNEQWLSSPPRGISLHVAGVGGTFGSGEDNDRGEAGKGNDGRKTLLRLPLLLLLLLLLRLSLVLRLRSYCYSRRPLDPIKICVKSVGRGG